MSGIGNIDLSVAIIEADGHALYAINAYLAWDRRTRVRLKADSLEEFWLAMGQEKAPASFDVVIMDADECADARTLSRAIRNLRDNIHGVIVLCLAQTGDLDMLYAAMDAGARAFFLKTDVLLQIAAGVCFAWERDERAFIYSLGAREAISKLNHRRLTSAIELPGPRRYPDLTRRLRQAIILYAIEGMPVRLVADEMGISENTVRDYIKKAYRILESHYDDAGEFPQDMSQQEIAFMRLTALDVTD